MDNYKETLNLPKTHFAMKANLPTREPEQLSSWEAADVYTKLRLQRKQKESFILHLGPPYANGDIHMGHALTTVLKDIVVKSKTLDGYDAPLVPGWDCHGLPIELNVEKQIGKPDEQITVKVFRDACRAYALTQVERQKTAFKRLGILADWDNPYLTMDYQYEANIIRSLATIIEKGYVKRGFKPVHWCIDCQSALAEAEVIYQDKQSTAIDVRFIVNDEAALLSRFPTGETFAKTSPVMIPIWTTTPWTLPANQAVALHPKANYVLIECVIDQDKERLIVAEDLLDSVSKRYGLTSIQRLVTVPGHALEGLELQHPFYDRLVPVILADYVTMDTGTGAVHTAPGHGQDDYIAGKRYRLPIDNPVDARGYFVKDLPLFGGQSVFEANPKVIEVLQARHRLIHVETITHSYPHCWRHKTPLLFRATPQWFIDLDVAHLREKLLEEIERVEWFPKWGKVRIRNMIEQRIDWCISRQRKWLVPIAVFVHKETGELHPNTIELMEVVAKAVEQSGIDAWDELDQKTLLGSDADDYVKIMDGLDVWFESGVSHSCVLKKRDDLRFPANVYLEGSDQYRGWFQSSLITACAMFDQSPYQQIITNGFTLDAAAQKMSKSLGNTVVPDEIVKKYGADILRLWVASSDYQSDMSVSRDHFERESDLYRRIRNTARFLLSNLYDFDPMVDMLEPDQLLALDQWVIDKANSYQAEIQQDYRQYQFHSIVQKIHYFCAIDLGSFYLDIIKDRQYTCKQNGIPRRSSQTAMYHLIQAMVRWLMPILSFTAEEIWAEMPGRDSESVLFSTWYTDLAPLGETKMNQAYFEQIRCVRDEVNKTIERLRAQSVLGSALEAEVTLYASPDLLADLTALGDELRFVFITSGAEIKPLSHASLDALDTDMDGLKISVTVSTHQKCVRCWHRRADVGQHADYPDLCPRCIENMVGDGEDRRFA